MAMEYFQMYYKYRKVFRRLSDEQVGRLVRRLLEYAETGKNEPITGEEALAYDFIADDIDRAKAAYEKKCEINRTNASKRYEKGAVVSDGSQYINNININSNKEKKKEEMTDALSPARKAYGEFGWVLLSTDEYEQIVSQFGEKEVERCIKYIDELAQSTGNKNEWRDWYLILRRCAEEGWGLKSQTKKKTGYNVQHHNDELSDLELAAVQRILTADEEDIETTNNH